MHKEVNMHTFNHNTKNAKRKDFIVHSLNSNSFKYKVIKNMFHALSYLLFSFIHIF